VIVVINIEECSLKLYSNSKNLETICSSIEEWLSKLWYVPTSEPASDNTCHEEFSTMLKYT
jgi:hypothetical protein